MSERHCDLCGHEGHDVRPALIAWAEPIGGARFDAGPRCTDHVECRRRVEAAGERWAVMAEIPALRRAVLA